MKEIPLTQGKVALVDDCDYPSLAKHTWFAHKHRQTFYASRQVRIASGRGGQRMLRMHTAIMGKLQYPLQYDHIDGNGLNNQRCNIRTVTSRENAQNLHISKTSKYPGVHRMRRDNTWAARINWGLRNVRSLGYFDTEESAYEAYCIACTHIDIIKDIAPRLEKGTFPFWFRKMFYGICC